MCNFLGKNDIEPMDSECMKRIDSVEGFESVESVEGIESVEDVSVLLSWHEGCFLAGMGVDCVERVEKVGCVLIVSTSY